MNCAKGFGQDIKIPTNGVSIIITFTHPDIVYSLLNNSKSSSYCHCRSGENIEERKKTQNQKEFILKKGILTSNVIHFFLMMETSLACSGATCCLTVMDIFFELFHCSGSSCNGKQNKTNERFMLETEFEKHKYISYKCFFNLLI